MAIESSQAAVDIQSISRRFNGRTVLDKIDLKIERGEFFVLIGPSGSGKSTLLKIISGVDQSDAGRLLIDGQDVTDHPPYRRPVHTVFQSYALFPNMDVAGNVGFPLRIAGIKKPRRDELVRQALSWVRMESFASRRIDKLSGGERQRVALARALVDEPRCVLLDEPLSALDPHLRGATLELLQEIQTRLKVTYIYVTHDRLEALRAGQRIGVLNDGKLIQVGTAEQLYNSPHSPFVASFIGPINWIEWHIVASDDSPAMTIAGGRRIPIDDRAVASDFSTVSLGIRPEDIEFCENGFFAARIARKDFCGASVMWKLESSDGATITAETRGGHPSLTSGDTVGVRWKSSAAHLFPRVATQGL